MYGISQHQLLLLSHSRHQRDWHPGSSSCDVVLVLVGGDGVERIQVVVHQLAQLGQVVASQVEESLLHLHVLTLDCCGERALCVLLVKSDLLPADWPIVRSHYW